MTELSLKDRIADTDIDRKTPAEIAASLRPSLEGATVLVGPGQYSPYPEHERVGVLRVSGWEKPELVWDRFYPKSKIGVLRTALRGVCRVLDGEFDTMYATGWSFAWTVLPTPFRVFDSVGALAAEEGGALHLRRNNAPVDIPVREIERVAGWVAADWVARGVSIVKRGGERIDVAVTHEWSVAIDPTYDGLNLLCDAAWAAQLGKAMARGLGVPYVSEDIALR
jgi:hypothetical protein